jgi:Sec-independent protein translocase protein TatA
MIDVSWGETAVLFGVGIFLIGRNDLPRASRVLGKQVGRVVGILQGARARADRFTADNELRALQNELRSGLRELDVVRGELAVAASGSGLMGKGLGTMVPGANRRVGPTTSTSVAAAAAATAAATSLQSQSAATTPPLASSAAPSGQDYLAAARSAEAAMSSQQSSPTAAAASISNPLGLAPRSQSVGAVAEEEWAKQGIGFVSRAERGTGAWEGTMDDPNTGVGGAGSGGGAAGRSSGAGQQISAGGAVLLADVIQQSLIHDQYDRAVREQDEALDRRAERIREEKERDDRLGK